MLKAFAYWEETPAGGYRRGTLLVGHGVERVVGNAVLKNPGSARPLETESKRSDGRLEFSVDPTMYALAELFGIDKNGGTIRLFNLSSIREADFSKAKKLIDTTAAKDDDVAVEITNGPAVPTYLGWGDLYKNPRLKVKAGVIFEAAKKNTPIHPIYLMRYARNKDVCVQEAEQFRAIFKQ